MNVPAKLNDTIQNEQCNSNKLPYLVRNSKYKVLIYNRKLRHIQNTLECNKISVILNFFDSFAFITIQFNQVLSVEITVYF